MRENISITIDIEILKKVDSLSDKESRSRSSMVEILLKRQLIEEEKKANQA